MMTGDMIASYAPKFGALLVLGFAALGLLMLPGALKLGDYRRRSLEGATTLEEAAELCRRSGLEGWALVTYAQHLAGRKFLFYSIRNCWDTPGRAFAHGAGYCTQYNLALKRILEKLGFKPKVVFSLRVRVLDNEAWNMGHTWLRVEVAGEVRDVCAGRLENTPGQVNFIPLMPVWPGAEFTLFLTHLGLIFLSGIIHWKALLSGVDPPEWTWRRSAMKEYL